MSHDKTETSTYRNTSSSTETDTAMSSFFGVSVGETLFNCSPFWQVIRMQQCLFDATFACRVIHVLKLLLHQLQVMVSLPRPKLDAKRYKLGFHLCSNSIWILRPEMNPGHLSHPWPPSPLSPKHQKNEKVDEGPQMKLGRRLHHVQVLQISRIPSLFSTPPPPHPTPGN